MSGARPLAGIRVLDFTHVLAGPACTRVLNEFGADVVRVENAKRPDALQSAPAEHVDRTLAYVMMHYGKRSISLDLKDEGDRATARRLASVADVVVENFSAGVMQKLGLDYASLRPGNERLVFVSMSGYGHAGPRRHWTSMNSNLQGYSGLMMATENEDQPPVAVSNSWMDYIGGLQAAFAVIDRLTDRETSGEGCFIDLSQFECGVASLGATLLAGIVDGVPAARMGNRSAHAAPQGLYPCAGDDAWCAISVENDAQWRSLARETGVAAWAADERFADLAGRMRYHDEIDRRLAEWTTPLAASDVEAKLQRAGITAAQMRHIDDVLDQPAGTTAFRFVPGPTKPVLMTAPPFAFSSEPDYVFGPAAELGEHTASVMRDWLAVDA
jgi:benzylsuccinate CoA-transferase BbsF subunit